MTMNMNEFTPHPASYRDPSGFVFEVNGIWYRQVNQSYTTHYEHLIQSGLYNKLVEQGLLVSHEELEKDLTGTPGWYKTLLPQQIPLISYPSQWCPGQLRDAALLTLKILRIAIDHGMVLKDASPSNVQFSNGRPIFIDTLSFEKYDPSRPWVAYRQFCECFLYPLYLHYFHNMGVGQILNAWPEGIPAALTARLLPLKSRFHLGVWLHVVLPGKIHNDRLHTGSRPNSRISHPEEKQIHSFSRTKLLHLAGNLEDIIKRSGKTDKGNSVWSNYYQETILSKAYLGAKEKLFREFIREISFDVVLDAGANDGFFSKILKEGKKNVIAIDSDYQCINNLYLSTLGKNDGISNLGKSVCKPPFQGTILPLCIDIANLSPAIGSGNTEWVSFLQRVNAGLVIALALIHHLVLGRNIPLSAAALLFSKLAQPYLIIEFVPLADPKAQALIKYKSQSHPYNEETFENSFRLYFIIEKKEMIPGTERVMYQMKKTDFVLAR